jgi:hypothetical protein
LCKGWSSWRGKKFFKNVWWILTSLWNIINFLSVEKTIDHLFKRPMRSAICFVMHIGSS